MYKIYLESFLNKGSKCLIGRDMGKHIRDTLNLKDLESEGAKIKFIFPENLFCVSGPFLCGLLGDSYKRLRAEFLEVYSFQGKQIFLDRIKTDVIDYIERIDKDAISKMD